VSIWTRSMPLCISATLHAPGILLSASGRHWHGPDGRELHVVRRKWTWIDSQGGEHKTMNGAMTASEQGGTDGRTEG